MLIHLIDIDNKPESGSIVKANCGEKIIFNNPITINYSNEGRLCETCHFIHRNSIKHLQKTFAHTKEK